MARQAVDEYNLLMITSQFLTGVPICQVSPGKAGVKPDKEFLRRH